MNLTKNYYKILGVSHESSNKEIKKIYYKLSFEHHPDKGGDQIIFSEISESYNILMDPHLREEYDNKSRWGKNYSEINEFFNVDFNIDHLSHKKNYDNFKKNEVLTIIINIDDSFDGELEYERWVMCKTCDGSGKDLKSKIVVKDELGNIKGIFDSEDGCDFCEGSGKDFRNEVCGFCSGLGKVGVAPCSVCDGEKRVLGKQKASNIELSGDETRIKGMGNFSKSGSVGDLLILNKNSD